MINDPDIEKEAAEKPSDEEEQSGSFFFGGSFHNEIGLALLAGIAFGAFQWGGDGMDRLAKWIDGELEAPAVATTIDLPDPDGGLAEISHRAQADNETTTAVAPEETPSAQSPGVIDDDLLALDSFRLTRNNSWLVEPNFGLFEPHPYFGHLLDAHLSQGRKEPALLPTIPEFYLVQLPDDAGQVFLLTKRVFINRQMDSEEVRSVVEEIGSDSVQFVHFPEGTTNHSPGTAPVIDVGKQLVLLGNVPSATISENDLFDQYFLEHLRTILSLRNTHGSIDLRHIRRSVIDGYEIGEIDYVIGTGTLRLTCVFYWHYEARAPWGDFGLFLSLRREPVSKAHKQEFETMSSLAIMEGEREIWRGLNFDAPADDGIGSFAHVALDANRLLMFGMDVALVEHWLETQLPTSIDGIEDAVIRTDGTSTVYLGDVADLGSFLLGEDDTLRTSDSFVLTVTQ